MTHAHCSVTHCTDPLSLRSASHGTCHHGTERQRFPPDHPAQSARNGTLSDWLRRQGAKVELAQAAMGSSRRKHHLPWPTSLASGLGQETASLSTSQHCLRLPNGSPRGTSRCMCTGIRGHSPRYCCRCLCRRVVGTRERTIGNPGRGRQEPAHYHSVAPPQLSGDAVKT